MRQKAQGGIVVRSIVCDKVSDLVTGFVFPKYGEQKYGFEVDLSLFTY